MEHPANGALALAVGTALLLIACSDDLARSRDIIFVATRPGATEDTYALHLADLTTRRLIKADSATSRSLPAWSPDTRSIAFIREFDDRSQLYVLDSVGGTPRQLAASLDKFLAWPDWSPDGASILFTGGSPDHRAAVYVIHSDGSGLRRIPPDSISLRCPSWAPDGHQFTVSAYVFSTSAATQYENGRCTDLRAGSTIRLRATRTSDTSSS